MPIFCINGVDCNIEVGQTFSLRRTPLVAEITKVCRPRSGIIAPICGLLIVTPLRLNNEGECIPFLLPSDQDGNQLHWWGNGSYLPNNFIKKLLNIVRVVYNRTKFEGEAIMAVSDLKLLNAKDDNGYIIEPAYLENIITQLGARYGVHDSRLSYVTERNAVWRSGSDVGSAFTRNNIITKVVISDKYLSNMRELPLL
jgi:hypothetical protein